MIVDVRNVNELALRLLDRPRIEALRQYAAYQLLMREELGLEPAREITELFAEIETTAGR